MTVYAKLVKSPKADYLTRGVQYEVNHEGPRGSFSIVDDEGEGIICNWRHCGHGGGDVWERVEIPDENPCKDLPIQRDSEGNYWLKLPMTATVHQIAEARRVLDGY